MEVVVDDRPDDRYDITDSLCHSRTAALDVPIFGL
jgi:hypothetical protein